MLPLAGLHPGKPPVDTDPSAQHSPSTEALELMISFGHLSPQWENPVLSEPNTRKI